jgi:hypothetical protein
LMSILLSCTRISRKELPKEVGVEGMENIAVKKVELQELTSLPRKWKDSLIETQGYFISGFEESALYVSRTGDGLERDAVWINLEDRLWGKIDMENYSGKKIKVRGRVSLKKGHLMQYAATIGNVYYVAIAEE